MPPKGQLTNATFSFKGVIVAENQQFGIKLREILELLCSAIINSYSACNDPKFNDQQKLAKLYELTMLGPQIEFIEEYCRSETQSCKLPASQTVMKNLYQKVQNQVRSLKADFKVLRQDPKLFPRVFDILMELFETINSFMKESHKVEVMRLLDIAQKTLGLGKQLKDLNRIDQLQEFGQFVTKKINDLFQSVKRLVTAQAHPSLEDRLQSCQNIIKIFLPNLITQVKLKFENPSPKVLADHAKASRELISCLEEVVQIIKDVHVQYRSDLTEDRELPVDPKVQKFADDVENVGDLLMRMQTSTAPVEKDQLAKRVGEAAKKIAGDLSAPEQKKLKQVIDDGLKDSQPAIVTKKELGQLVSNVKAKAKLEMHGELEGETEETKDLLTAAQDMLNALKGITATLDIVGLS